MGSTSSTVGRAKESAATFGRFVWHDLKATVARFVKSAGVTLLGLGVALWIYFLAYLHHRDGSFGPSPGLTVVVALVMAAYYAAIPSLVVGAVVAGWRLVGATLLLPLLTLPLASAATLELFAPLVSSRARALADAFLVAARIYHWPTLAAFGRLAHAGPVAIPFLLGAAVFDGVHLLGDGRVAMALLWLCLVLLLLLAVAAALVFVLTLPPVAWVFVRRARARWQSWSASRSDAPRAR